MTVKEGVAGTEERAERDDPSPPCWCCEEYNEKEENGDDIDFNLVLLSETAIDVSGLFRSSEGDEGDEEWGKEEIPGDDDDDDDGDGGWETTTGAFMVGDW